MDIKEAVADAIWDELCPGIRRSLDDQRRYTIAGAEAITAIRKFIADDTTTATRVAAFTSLRQASNETPAGFVRRIVGAYMFEAILLSDGWPGTGENVGAAVGHPEAVTP